MKLRANSGCIHELDLIKLKPLKKFDVDVRCMGELMTRKMVEATVMFKKQYIDIVTGTLYDPETGKSNSPQVFIEKIYKL